MTSLELLEVVLNLEVDGVQFGSEQVLESKVGTEGRREPNIANPTLAFHSRATPGCPASIL